MSSDSDGIDQHIESIISSMTNVELNECKFVLSEKNHENTVANMVRRSIIHMEPVNLLSLLFELYCEPSKAPLTVGNIDKLSINEQLDILNIENLSLQKIRQEIPASLYHILPQLKTKVYKRVRFKYILLSYYRSYIELNTTPIIKWTPKQLCLSLIIYLVNDLQQQKDIQINENEQHNISSLW
eukprot:452221_1